MYEPLWLALSPRLMTTVLDTLDFGSIPVRGAARSPQLTRGLAEAMRGASGVMRVTGEEASGSVFVTRGRIAWAAADAGGDRLTDALLRGTEVSMAQLRNVFRECRASRSNFAEGLVAAGHVDRETMRRVLMEHNSEQLRRICAGGGRAHYDESDRHYDSHFSFNLGELLLPLVASAPLLVANLLRGFARHRLSFEGLDPTSLHVATASLRQCAHVEAAAVVDVAAGVPLDSIRASSLADAAAASCAYWRAPGAVNPAEAEVSAEPISEGGALELRVRWRAGSTLSAVGRYELAAAVKALRDAASPSSAG